jgi:flagellum-specific peptidoglycan hydrolase FlgJ
MERKKVLGLVAVGGALAAIGYLMREQITTATIDIWAGLTGKKGPFAQKYAAAWAQTSKRLPLEMLLPQAALESSWGTSRIATSFNNLHGRKGAGTAGTSAPGSAVELDPNTGKYVTVTGTTWAVYPSWVEAIEDQQAFLLNPKNRYLNPYYNAKKKPPEQAAGLKNVTTVRDAWRSIVAAGYATDNTEKYVRSTASVANGLRLNPDAPLRVA